LLLSFLEREIQFGKRDPNWKERSKLEREIQIGKRDPNWKERSKLEREIRMLCIVREDNASFGEGRELKVVYPGFYFVAVESMHGYSTVYV
jgi:hypothetical protein